MQATPPSSAERQRAEGRMHAVRCVRCVASVACIACIAFYPSPKIMRTHHSCVPAMRASVRCVHYVHCVHYVRCLRRIALRAVHACVRSACARCVRCVRCVHCLRCLRCLHAYVPPFMRACVCMRTGVHAHAVRAPALSGEHEDRSFTSAPVHHPTTTSFKPRAPGSTPSYLGVSQGVSGLGRRP